MHQDLHDSEDFVNEVWVTDKHGHFPQRHWDNQSALSFGPPSLPWNPLFAPTHCRCESGCERAQSAPELILIQSTLRQLAQSSSQSETLSEAEMSSDIAQMRASAWRQQWAESDSLKPKGWLRPPSLSVSAWHPAVTQVFVCVCVCFRRLYISTWFISSRHFVPTVCLFNCNKRSDFPNLDNLWVCLEVSRGRLWASSCWGLRICDDQGNGLEEIRRNWTHIQRVSKTLGLWRPLTNPRHK